MPSVFVLSTALCVIDLNGWDILKDEVVAALAPLRSLVLLNPHPLGQAVIQAQTAYEACIERRWHDGGVVLPSRSAPDHLAETPRVLAALLGQQHFALLNPGDQLIVRN